jgi:hypothetical protein
MDRPQRVRAAAPTIRDDLSLMAVRRVGGIQEHGMEPGFSSVEGPIQLSFRKIQVAVKDSQGQSTLL